ncbi:MAG TPA: CoA transferase [Leptospiraceae bacterium]|nr:CoA transferase [Leptospiraceae bacterium]
MTSLNGIRVLDLSAVFPFPMAAAYLADLGADVIKIENPRLPDPSRKMGSPSGSTQDGSIFVLANRNKRCLSLNLKRPRGMEVFKKLLANADVLIESFLPGTTSRLGITYDDLRDSFPRLVYCHGSPYGYGQSSRPAHEINIAAEAGLIATTGTASTPVPPGFQPSDVAGAFCAVGGILAALLARHQTGRGQFVNASLFDGAMSMLSLVAAEHLAGGNTDRGKMDVSGMAPGYRVYQTREGFIALGTLEDAAYEKFLNYIDRKHIKNMPEESQIAELSRYFLDCDSSSIQRLIDAELLVSRVNSVAEAMTSARLRTPTLLQRMPQGGETLGAPFHLSETPVSIRSGVPERGEHTRDILKTLGYSQAEYEELQNEGVVA